MKDGVPYALDDEYVKWLYKQQNGKCFYSDIAIIWGHAEQNKQLSLSIDKVIPSKGYVKGNVVLAQTRINSAKSDFSLEEMKLWMPEWYRRIVTSEWLDAKSYGVYHTV
jgi:CRISPR/Cas system Type II protein with McrA/HNH and RuvC-like nuclease domain